MKIIALNGSPRKGWNTEKLLQSALDGAKTLGAETELMQLYDQEFKGCISCFACKVRGGRSNGICAYKDSLSPILKKSLGADAIIIGSPIYFDYPTILKHNESNVGRLLGYSETLYSCDTYQYEDYSRMDNNMFDEVKKAEHRDKQFPIDIKNAFEMGQRLVQMSEV